MKGMRRHRWPLAMLTAVLIGTCGIAYAAIPGGGGVIHTCYTKSSGSWRVIDAEAGQTCRSNEAALELYSKSGADTAFLGVGAKAADSEMLDGLDSTAFLGASAKAADSDRLDGVDSTGFLRIDGKAADSETLDGLDSSAFLSTSGKAADADQLDGLDSFLHAQGLSVLVVTDYKVVADGETGFHAFSAEDTYPGMRFDFQCDVDQSWTMTAKSPEAFDWWWRDSFGSSVLVGDSHIAELDVGQGLQRRSFRASSKPSNHTTVLELDVATRDDACVLGLTQMRSRNDSPGHP